MRRMYNEQECVELCGDSGRLAAVRRRIVSNKGVSISQEIIALPYICIGVGCGAFGHGMGNIISKRALKIIPIFRGKLKLKRKTNAI